jgi:hypothetical protein
VQSLLRAFKVAGAHSVRIDHECARPVGYEEPEDAGVEGKKFAFKFKGFHGLLEDAEKLLAIKFPNVAVVSFLATKASSVLGSTSDRGAFR